jgi:predicted nuclease of predicted toxin-antitoxin system
MRLLLDENLPKRLKLDLQEYEVFTIQEKGWAGKTNGALLQLMTTDNFNALLTFDKNLQYQQNFKKYTLAVFVLVASDNSYLTLKELVPKIKEVINAGFAQGPIEIKV